MHVIVTMAEAMVHLIHSLQNLAFLEKRLIGFIMSRVLLWYSLFVSDSMLDFEDFSIFCHVSCIIS